MIKKKTGHSLGRIWIVIRVVHLNEQNTKKKENDNKIAAALTICQRLALSKLKTKRNRVWLMYF